MRWGSRPNGGDVPLLAVLEERVPDVLAVRAREVDLVAELADEADAQDQRGHAGDVGVLRVEVGEGLVRDVDVAQPLHQAARVRAGRR